MPSMIPKVAVITRTKDRGILLERAIKSVHQQSMTDFIHVIINDGGNRQVVDDLVSKYRNVIKGRVRVIHNNVSGGMEAASNKAIKSVDSTYVAIHDDDDSWHPEFLRRTTELMEQSGAEGVITRVDRIDEEIVGDSVQIISRQRWLPYLLGEVKTLRLYDLCLSNFAVPISFIYRRRVFKEIGYYDETLPVCGDWDFALRFMSKHDIELLDTEESLAYYHLRFGNAGVMGNSIFAGADKHEIYGTKLANRYLRQDIQGNGLGIGYLFNSRQTEAKRANLRDREEHDRHELIERKLMERTLNMEKIKRIIKRLSPRIYNRLKG